MKYLWLLGVLGFGQFLLAQTNDITILSTMRCVREIAENRLGGREGLTKAAEFIDALNSNGDLSSACEEFANSTSAINISRKQQIEFLNSEANISAKARSVLTKFIVPKATCHKIGLSAQAGAYDFGISAKLDGAKCSATNGRTWLEISPGLGRVTPDKGVLSVNVNLGVLEREIEPVGLPVDVSTTYQMAEGALVTVQIEDETNFDAAPTVGDQISYLLVPAGVFGAGLGVGAGVGFGGQINIALIPTGTDQALLLEAYLK